MSEKRPTFAVSKETEVSPIKTEGIMVNMAHCRFENTYCALLECIDHLDDNEEMSEQESIYADKIEELLEEFHDALEGYRERNNKRYVCVDGCGYVELKLDQETAQRCYHSGECYSDVCECMNIPYIREQLDELSDEQIDKCLAEIYGEGEEATKGTRTDKEEQILFLAAAEYIDQIVTIKQNRQ